MATDSVIQVGREQVDHLFELCAVSPHSGTSDRVQVNCNGWRKTFAPVTLKPRIERREQTQVFNSAIVKQNAAAIKAMLDDMCDDQGRLHPQNWDYEAAHYRSNGAEWTSLVEYVNKLAMLACAFHQIVLNKLPPKRKEEKKNKAVKAARPTSRAGRPVLALG